MESLKPGTVFHNYLIVRLIGRGGMGEVYETIESQTNRRVALKVIQQKPDKNEEILRFLNEAQSLGQVCIIGQGSHRLGRSTS